MPLRGLLKPFCRKHLVTDSGSIANGMKQAGAHQNGDQANGGFHTLFIGHNAIKREFTACFYDFLAV